MRSIKFLMLLLLAVPAAQATTLKLATLAPEGTYWMQTMHQGADEIAQRTEGRVKIKFYAGGSMGTDRVVLRKVRAGQLHGGALTGGALAEVYKDVNIYTLPMLFRSYAELDYIRARFDQRLAKGLEQNGFVSFGFIDGGFAEIMSNDPIHGVADLQSQKEWVPEGDELGRAMFETLGTATVPLPLTDVLTGLQTGLITSIGSIPTGAIAMQWHTHLKYVVDLPTMYVFGVLVVEKKTFAKLSAADQAVVREVIGRVIADMNRKSRDDEKAAHEALRKQGITFITLSPEELKKLRAAADKTIKRLAKEGAVSAPLLKDLQGELVSYRRKHPAH